METLRFGKHPPKIDYRTLRFKDYLTPEIAAPPATYNVLTSVYQNLQTTDPTMLFPMDGNDTYGDCTIAALAHAITMYEALIGRQKIMSSQAVVKLYFHLTGGVDSGLNELDVLNYWRQHRVTGDEIITYVSINPRNHTHVQQAIQLFGGVYLGFQVQQNCIQEFNAHQPWTPGPLTNDGHAVYAVAYDQNELTVLTWGILSRQPGPGGMSAWMRRTPFCRRKLKSRALRQASTSRSCKQTLMRWRTDAHSFPLMEELGLSRPFDVSYAGRCSLSGERRCSPLFWGLSPIAFN